MIKEIFKRMCEIRYFELEVIKAHQQGRIYCPVYLSMGQEAVASTLSVTCFGYKIFTQHRGHSWYLAYGGNQLRLRDEILGKPTGCCQGKGGSSDIQSFKMEAHHGLIGEQVPIGVGYALASNIPVLIQMGDGAIEEDCSLASLGFVVKHNLPVLFVCEDNGLSILTPIEKRRNWKAVDVARGFGLKAFDLEDDPYEIMNIEIDLPMFLNIRTCRHRWHVGIGNDGEPQIDRLALIRDMVDDNQKIEKTAKERMLDIWKV